MARPTSKPKGRPSGYTDEIAATICERIAEGESIRDICASDDMPSTSMVFRWLAKEEHASFREQYARARETQADVIFDEILTIADDARNDWMKRENGDGKEGKELNTEHLQRSRLRIDARKWMAGKLRPKVYGDRVAIGGDKDMDPIQTEETGANLSRLLEMVTGIAERNRDTGDATEE